MKQYTGKERVLAALNRQYADRVPINIAAEGQFAKLLGFTLTEFETDLEKALKSVIAAQEAFPSDMMRVPGNPYLPSTQMTRREVTSETKRRLEDKSAIAKFKIRDPREDRLYAPFIQMCRRVNSMYESSWPQALVAAPWSVAIDIRGTEELMRILERLPLRMREKLMPGSAKELKLSQRNQGRWYP